MFYSSTIHSLVYTFGSLVRQIQYPTYIYNGKQEKKQFYN